MKIEYTLAAGKSVGMKGCGMTLTLPMRFAAYSDATHAYGTR